MPSFLTPVYTLKQYTLSVRSLLKAIYFIYAKIAITNHGIDDNIINNPAIRWWGFRSKRWVKKCGS
jgi:hypothetical protein